MARLMTCGFTTSPVHPIEGRSFTVYETVEGNVSAKAGDFLCRGSAGELWPVTATTLESRYTVTEAVDSDGWRTYRPRLDAEGVMPPEGKQPLTLEETMTLLDWIRNGAVFPMIGVHTAASASDH